MNVIGALRASEPRTHPALGVRERDAVTWVRLDLRDSESVRAVAELSFDAVVHLAAVASGLDAREDPGAAWEVNAGGTARLLHKLALRVQSGDADPKVVVASTGEVYGIGGTQPSREDDVVSPCSPYAASKLGAELSARETRMRTAIRTLVVRPFQQLGPGQGGRYFVPSVVRRLLRARREGGRLVQVGSLAPVRDFVDVRDVASAIAALLDRGTDGEVYNISTGCGVSLRDLFYQAAVAVGIDAIPETSSELTRSADLPVLVGDSGKCRAATGWEPAHSLQRTLQDIVNYERALDAQ